MEKIDINDPINYMLSEHFSLYDLIRSGSAEKLGIDNNPLTNGDKNPIVDNLKILCETILEPLYDLLGPLKINSGYRSPEVNKAVGGSNRSQHRYGKAVDFVCSLSVEDTFQTIIKNNLDYDQLLQEFDRWTHISYDKDKETQRRSTLRVVSKNGKITYLPA